MTRSSSTPPLAYSITERPGVTIIEYEEEDEHALGDHPRRKNSRGKIERATRRAESFALRRAGLPVSVIAQRMGVQPRTVQAWITEAVRAIPQQEADDLRTLELSRLDELQAAVWSQARAGDTRAVDTVLRIMERRAKYLNLDSAPVVGFEAVGNLLDRLVLGIDQ